MVVLLLCLLAVGLAVGPAMLFRPVAASSPATLSGFFGSGRRFRVPGLRSMALATVAFTVTITASLWPGLRVLRRITTLVATSMYVIGLARGAPGLHQHWFRGAMTDLRHASSTFLKGCRQHVLAALAMISTTVTDDRGFKPTLA